MSLAPRHWANAFFLWLSLATVLVPAIGSSGSPLRLTEGSAFSAFTSDVSLGPSRAAPIEDNKQTAPDDRDGGSALPARAGLVLPHRDMSDTAPSRTEARSLAPPLQPARLAAGPIGPRAPPIG